MNYDSELDEVLSDYEDHVSEVSQKDPIVEEPEAPQESNSHKMAPNNDVFEDEINNFFGQEEKVVQYGTNVPNENHVEFAQKSDPEEGSTVATNTGEKAVIESSSPRRAVSAEDLSEHESSESSSPREIIRQQETISPKQELRKSEAIVNASSNARQKKLQVDILKTLNTKPVASKIRSQSKLTMPTTSVAAKESSNKVGAKKLIDLDNITRKNEKMTSKPTAKITGTPWTSVADKSEKLRSMRQKQRINPILSIQNNRLNSTFVVGKPPRVDQPTKVLKIQRAGDLESIPRVSPPIQRSYLKSLNSTFTIEPVPPLHPAINIRERWKTVKIPRFRSAYRPPSKIKEPLRAVSAVLQQHLPPSLPDYKMVNPLKFDPNDDNFYDPDLQPIVNFTVKDSKNSPSESFWNYLLEHPELAVRAQSPDLEINRPNIRPRPVSPDLLMYDRILTEARRTVPIKVPLTKRDSRQQLIKTLPEMRKAYSAPNPKSDQYTESIKPASSKINFPVKKEVLTITLAQKTNPELLVKKEVLVQLSKINDYSPAFLRQVLMDSFDFFIRRRPEHGLSPSQISSILLSLFNELVQV